ncbi:hypothetical protein MPER_04929, partial [Moniliophthora perniciosa FA553]
HIWGRTYIEGVNELYQKFVDAFPHYRVIPGRDRQRDHKEKYLRKEELRRWMWSLADWHFLCAVDESHEEIDGLSDPVSLEEYSLGNYLPNPPYWGRISFTTEIRHGIELLKLESGGEMNRANILDSVVRNRTNTRVTHPSTRPVNIV